MIVPLQYCGVGVTDEHERTRERDRRDKRTETKYDEMSKGNRVPTTEAKHDTAESSAAGYFTCG